MNKLTLILIAIGLMTLSVTGVVFAGPKPPKSICLNLEGSDSYIIIVTKKSGSIKMSDGKATLYDIQGIYYEISGFNLAAPIKGTGYMVGNVFKFSAMGAEEYDTVYFWYTSLGGYWDVNSDTGRREVRIMFSHAIDNDDWLKYALLEVPCNSLSVPNY